MGGAVTFPVWSHLPSASPGPNVNASITNYRLGLTFSSFDGKGREDGEVTLERLTVPSWPEGQACCPLFGRARTQSRKFCTPVAILCTKRGAHGETALRRLPEVHLAPEPTLPRMAGGALSPEHTGSAAGTGAHPAPINHIPQPLQLFIPWFYSPRTNPSSALERSSL